MRHLGSENAHSARFEVRKNRLVSGRRDHWPWWAEARYFTAFLVLMSVVACGGGGGGANVAQSPQLAAQLTPGALTFGTQQVGTSSAVQMATLTNSGSATIN